MKKKSIIVIVALSLVVVFLLVYKQQKIKNPEVVKKEEPKSQEKREVEYLGAETLPPNLPEDLPMEGSLEIKRNEIVNTTSAKGEFQTQFVRSYYTEKTVAENLKIYKDYSAGKGWQVSEEITDGKTFATFFAYDTVGKSTFRFEFSENTVTKDKVVTITLIKT